MAERLNLMVDDGIRELMTKLASSDTRRGQWLGTWYVRAMDEQESQALGSDLEAMRPSFAGLAGQTKHLEGRLVKVEQLVAAKRD